MPDKTAALTAILVEDHGVGMSDDVLQRCTEVFYSTKKPDRGSGLGLSAVQGFALQSGGQLRIESILGQGTQVSLLLPATESGGGL